MNSWVMEWFDAKYYKATIYGNTYREAVDEYARKYWSNEDRSRIGKVTLMAVNRQEVAL